MEQEDYKFKKHILEDSEKFKNELIIHQQEKRKKILQYRDELNRQKMDNFNNKNDHSMNETEMMINKELLNKAINFKI